jgi:carbon-monoxide dehydrogenase medium subunit
VRHEELFNSIAARDAVPLLAQALSHVAHPVIRNRGTSVGSIAHADPSGELTAVLALLEGVVTIEGRRGVRQVSGVEFFVGPLESVINPGEVATKVSFARLPSNVGTSCVTEELQVETARVSLFSVGPTPILIDVSDLLAGTETNDNLWREAARFIGSTVEPESDIHATADYRKNLVEVLAAKGLRKSYENALTRMKAGQ